MRVPPLKYAISNCEGEDEESMTYLKDLATDFLNDVETGSLFIHSYCVICQNRFCCLQAALQTIT